MNKPRTRVSVGEFASLSAMLFSLVALSIDAMLPALPHIAADLDVANINDTQLVIGLFFLGNGVGQLLFGPISDAFGRKPVIIAGLVLFLVGCVFSILAQSFTALLIGRVLQGFGSAGPRTVTISLIRDLYSGPAMARIMSFSMAIFIMVPTLAPLLGQAILWVADWRYIFVSFLVMGVVAMVWLMLRQAETLSPQHRTALRLSNLVSGVMSVARSRTASGYILATGAIFAAFLGYLSSAQQIFQIGFGVGDAFPLWFGSLALVIGLSSLVNAKAVMRFGMHRLVILAIVILTAVSLLYLLIWFVVGDPGFTGFMVWGAISFFCIGLLFGNLNSLAMEPLGQIAGLGAALVGFVSTMISMLGIPLGLAFDGTPVPMISGFLVMGAICWLLCHWAGKGDRPE